MNSRHQKQRLTLSDQVQRWHYQGNNNHRSSPLLSEVFCGVLGSVGFALFRPEAMSEFSQLSPAVQFRRLRPLALAALEDFGLGNTKCTPLAHVQNATWQVVSVGNGQRYVLRVHTAQRHDLETIRSELVWLQALRDDHFVVPMPVPTRDGRLWTTAAAQGVPGERVCTLLHWLPGRIERRRRTPSMLFKIGSFMARLHNQAEHFQVPPTFVRPRWDYDGLTGRSGIMLHGWSSLTARQRQLFEEVTERLRPATKQVGVGRSNFGLIHGDLVFLNLLFHRGEVRAIDFDDCGFGYFLYDIAILLDHIEFRANYTALRESLLTGYRQVRPLSLEHEALLDLFLLGRWVFLGLSFLSQPAHAVFREYVPRFLGVVEPKIASYLRTMK